MGGIWDGTLCAVWCRCSAAIPRLGPRVFRHAGPSPALSAPVDVGAHCRGSLPKAPMRGAPAHGGTRRDGSAGPTRAEIAPPGSGVDPALVVDQMAAHVVDGSRASPTEQLMAAYGIAPQLRRANDLGARPRLGQALDPAARVRVLLWHAGVPRLHPGLDRRNLAAARLAARRLIQSRVARRSRDTPIPDPRPPEPDPHPPEPEPPLPMLRPDPDPSLRAAMPGRRDRASRAQTSAGTSSATDSTIRDA